MKKCAIVTLWGDNFGNKLQNYALQEFLKKNYELDVYTLVYQNERTKTKNGIKDKVISKVNSIRNKILYKKQLNDRKNKFLEFSKNYINKFERIITSKEDFKKLNDEFDFFIVGSDQVWNTYWEGKNPFFYLNFVLPQKRISYAASFGINSIDKKYKDMIATELKKFNIISVREEQGKKIINEMIEKEVEVLVDPTLLLSTEEWKTFSRNSRYSNITEKYIVTYFLGKDKHKKELRKLNKKTGYKIINLIDLNQKEFYSANPIDFVYLIKNAEYVFTDSFHACVFSIIFDKEFWVTSRQALTSGSMNSRIENLLNKFSMSDRFIDKIDDLQRLSNCSKINKSLKEKIINEEKEKSVKFLSTALINEGEINE